LQFLGHSKYVKESSKWAKMRKFMVFFSWVDVYGHGHSEKVISQVLKDRRQDVFLATKFGIDHSVSPPRANGSPEYVEKCCAESLERLGTDYIDLYFNHRIDKEV
jgi:aryl-alcohol dehydrogenase-like predicted oxidoreductase